MAKPLVNNRIIYNNIYGKVIQHDEFFDGGSPTFENIFITGDATIEGNLFVEGDTYLLESDYYQFQNNIIVINGDDQNSSTGVVLNQAGFEIERGILPNYRVVFDEPSDTFRIGFSNSTLPVVTRDDSPLSNGIMTWNNTEKKIVSVDTVNLAIKFANSDQSFSVTTGSVIVEGGIGVKQNISVAERLYLRGNSNSTNSVYTDSNGNLLLTTDEDIKLQPAKNLILPFDKSVSFGTTEQSISSNAGKLLSINSGGDIQLAAQSVKISQQIPLQFGNLSSVSANINDELVLSSQNDIVLTPDSGHNIKVPVDISIRFGSGQDIYSDITERLIISSNDDILLSPANGKYIQLDKTSGLRFGNAGDGDAGVYSNNQNNLLLKSPNKVVIDDGIYLSFGTSGNYYVTNDAADNLILKGQVSITCKNTTNSTSELEGALIVEGGMGVKKTVWIGEDLYVKGNMSVAGIITTENTQNLLVERNLIILNSSIKQDIDGGLLIKRGPGVFTDQYAAVYYKESTDEMTFAYTDMDPATDFVTINDYIKVSAKTLRLTDESDFNLLTSTGSLTTPGGIYVSKSAYIKNGITTGGLYASSSTLQNSNLTNITVSNVIVTGNMESKNITDSTDTSTGSVIIKGGIAIQKRLNVGDTSTFSSTRTSSNGTTGAVLLHGGLSVICTTNSTSYTSGGAVTVRGGIAVEKDVYIGGTLRNQNATFDNITTNTKINITSTENAVSVTGPSVLNVEGGVTIKKDVFVGESINAEKIKGEQIVSDTNRVLTSVRNTSSGKKWYYICKLTDFFKNGYCDMYLSDGLTTYGNGENIYNLHLVGSISSATANFNHGFYGTYQYDSDMKPNVYVYRDTSNDVHLFVLLPGNSVAHLDVKSFDGIEVLLQESGTGDTPTLAVTWTEIYNTNAKSNLHQHMGNINIDGKLRINDNFPIVGFENNNSNSKTGVLLERNVQNITSDTAAFSGILSSQGSMSSIQVRLPSTASSVENYYNGWILKLVSGATTQTRKIVNYHAVHKVADIETEWDTQPDIGDSIYLYNFNYVSMYYDESDKYFTVGLGTVDPETDLPVIWETCPIRVNQLKIANTSESFNASTGAIVITGGLGINNSANATSSTYGGSISTDGGMGIKRSLYVGESINIGTSGNMSSGDIFIKKASAKIVMERESNGYSYLDFVTSSGDLRYGIVNRQDILSITCDTNSGTPNTANSTLAICSTGNVGIGTTNANSILTLSKNNYISIDSEDGYIGISSSHENITSNSRILCYGKQHIASAGNVLIHTGIDNSATFEVHTDNEKRLSIMNNGIVQIFNTDISNGDTGAFIVNGGVTILSTEESIGFSSGGALTVNGGAAFGKDVYINGDLYVNGAVAATSAIEPITVSDLQFGNTVGCSVTDAGNGKEIRTGMEALLSFWVEVLPIAASSLCSFKFRLPFRVSNFTHRGEVMACCNGWTENTEILPVFNVLCIANTDEMTATVKFQSVSTMPHYFTIIARYARD